MFQNADDPNEVTGLHWFASVDEAHAFADDPDLKDAMARAGVSGLTPNRNQRRGAIAGADFLLPDAPVELFTATCPLPGGFSDPVERAHDSQQTQWW